MSEGEVRPLRILIADAEADRRAAVVRLLRGAGHQALEARDGPEALRLLQAAAADVALIDTHLPGLGGLEVLRQSRGASRPVPVVLLASPGSIREAVQAMQFGARNYLTRPLAGPELSQALREALRERPSAHAAPREPDEQARQAQKMEMVGRLAGGVAHDFNNLLTVINGYSEVVLQNLPAGHPARPCIEEVLRAVERGAAVTRQLLAFSRRQVLQAAVLDLNEVVARVEGMLRPLIGAHVELRLRLAAGPCWVNADQGQLEQVIVNLAVNARDAMPGGGTLTVQTGSAAAAPGGPWEDLRRAAPGPAGRWVVLAVTDTGVGMDTATQGRIFEPFFTTKEPGKGTGLGLATVQGIVQQSGGRIEVRSDPGRGSTFTIYLPQSPPAVRPLETSGGASPLPRGTETILVLEDEEAVRGLVRRILEQQGYAVLTARDGEEAQQLALAHAGPIHLLLTDLVMPRMSGCEAARRLTLLRPALRVLYMSGYTNSPLLQQTLAETGAAALPKPFAAGPLARKVREVLDAS